MHSNSSALGIRRCPSNWVSYLVPIDEALEDLREVAIKNGYNCSKRIAYLKIVDLDILVNSNADGSQNRGRSQSAKK
ncbi:unnamed protein product, partial [Rotaria socialis]